MARVQKFKKILTETLLPDKAPAGTVFWCSDSQTLWLATASEEILNLSDILEGKHVGVRQRGPAGPEGKASTVPGPKGERGERGPAGHDAVCNCRVGLQGPKGDKGDNIVGPRGPAGPAGQSIVGPAGKDGQSIVGPAGPKGDSGDITVVGDAELLAAVNVLKAKHAQFLAALQVQVERNAGRKHAG
jgi:hypothetical protein